MREAVELEPTNIWYNLLLANILQRKSMIEEACKVYDKLILLHPEREDFTSWRLICILLLRSGIRL